MNAMCGIERLRMGNTKQLIVLAVSRTPSGRMEFPRTYTQGIALARSALGWVLMAFQAIPLVMQLTTK